MHDEIVYTELDSIYPAETENRVIGLILENKIQDALKILSNIADEAIGELFRPYEVLTLRFKFALTAVKVLKCLEFYENNLTAQLPTIDFEIYRKSPGTLKDELLKPMRMFEQKPMQNVLERKKLFYQINNYIKSNIKADISLADLSKYLGFSESYTSRIFPKITGESFKAYVNKAKIKYAKQLIESGCSIPQAMEGTGFTSRKTFNRTFVKFTGVPPGHYLTDEKT